MPARIVIRVGELLLENAFPARVFEALGAAAAPATRSPARAKPLLGLLGPIQAASAPNGPGAGHTGQKLGHHLGTSQFHRLPP
jgi:hypothetical protein